MCVFAWQTRVSYSTVHPILPPCITTISWPQWGIYTIRLSEQVSRLVCVCVFACIWTCVLTSGVWLEAGVIETVSWLTQQDRSSLWKYNIWVFEGGKIKSCICNGIFMVSVSHVYIMIQCVQYGSFMNAKPYGILYWVDGTVSTIERLIFWWDWRVEVEGRKCVQACVSVRVHEC